MVVGRINGVVALTGFSYEEMYGRFAETKKSGRNNEVVVRRGSTVYWNKQLTAKGIKQCMHVASEVVAEQGIHLQKLCLYW